ncbi:MAG: DUF948 domain-containing protein [Longimicrobiales bacterium]
MSFPALVLLQDTTMVSVARDTLATVSAWANVGLVIAFGLLLIVLTMILLQLRGLSRRLQGLLGTVTDRSRPLIDSANRAAENVNYITEVVRTDVDRVNQAFSGVAEGLEQASLDVQGRVKDLTALMDLAQTEAEDAVLDAATRVRTLRAGAGVMGRIRRRQGSSQSTGGKSAPDPPVDETDSSDG